MDALPVDTIKLYIPYKTPHPYLFFFANFHVQTTIGLHLQTVQVCVFRKAHFSAHNWGDRYQDPETAPPAGGAFYLDSSAVSGGN